MIDIYGTKRFAGSGGGVGSGSVKTNLGRFQPFVNRTGGSRR